ncbi:MAG TPA: hypothetical protein VJ717_19035 [Gemmatimonadaceae bacterium]|nr:hypothetical protein [Gemmatimonadaceae bacterium]
MKRLMLLAAVLCACGPREDAATDTAGMTAAAAGPAALTAADLAGTWSGVDMAEGSDSVLARFTVISPTGMDAKAVFEGSTDTVQVTHMIDADSVVATSAPYPHPTLRGKPQVTFRAVGRMQGGKLVGTSQEMLVSKPDSVVSRTRFELTKTG